MRTDSVVVGVYYTEQHRIITDMSNSLVEIGVLKMSDYRM